MKIDLDVIYNKIYLSINLSIYIYFMDNSESDTVKDLFNALSSKYDLFNDLFSFGLHRFWKSQLIGFLKPSIGENWIDLCCGTGDLTLCLARNIRPGGKVFGIDSASEALSLAS